MYATRGQKRKRTSSFGRNTYRLFKQPRTTQRTIMTQFPSVMYRKLKWTDYSTNARTMTITGGGSTSYGDQTSYLWNSLYAPNQNVAGPAQMGSLQEMASLYNACRVMAVEVRATFMYNAAQVANSVYQPLKVYIAGNPFLQTLVAPSNNTNWQGIEQFISANPKYACYGYLQSNGNQQTMITLKKFWSLDDYYGNKLEWNALATADQPVPNNSGSIPLASNPTVTLSGFVGVNLIDDVIPTVAITITCDTQFTFYTKWWNPKGQTN